MGQTPVGPPSDNQRRLGDLHAGTPGSTTPIPAPGPATAPNNQASLEQLQHGSPPPPPPPASTSPVPQSAPPSPPTPGAIPPRRVPRTLLWGAGAAVLLAGIVALIFTQTGASDPAPAAPAQDAIVTITPATSAPTGANAFVAPTDVAGLISLVKASTFPVYCGDYSGSAFLLDASALGAPAGTEVIVTNHHVVETCLDGADLQLVLPVSSISARVVATDVPNDLAILAAEINVPALSAAAVTTIGQWVMAVGSPLGVENTVTFGNVTNLIPNEAAITTDAAISPGSSGGPLVDSTGRVLGINSAVMQDEYGAAMGFAVTASQLCETLLDCRQ